MVSETVQTAPLREMSQTEAELRERILNDNITISILKSESEGKQKVIDELTAQLISLKKQLRHAKDQVDAITSVLHGD